MCSASVFHMPQLRSGLPDCEAVPDHCTLQQPFFTLIRDQQQMKRTSPPPCTIRCPTAPISSRLLTTPVLRICQRLDHELDCLCMCRHRFIGLFFLAAFRLVSQFSVNPDSLTDSLASTSSDSALISWNSKKKLPQLITNTFIFFPPNNLYFHRILRAILNSPHPPAGGLSCFTAPAPEQM